MATQASKNGHSAIVKMRLICGGRTLRIAQMGPESLILAELAELPPGPAEIHVEIDDESFHWEVELPEGVTALSRTVRISLAHALSRL